MPRASLTICLLLSACTAAEPPANPDVCPASGEVRKPPRIPKPSAHDEELVRAGREALHRRDGPAAIRAFEDALAGGSKSYLVDWSVRGELPFAYVVAGDLDRAATRVEELMADASHDVRLGLRETRADIDCARGDVPAAIARYRALVDDVKDKNHWNDGLNYTYLLEVSAKLRLLDHRIPDLEPAWIVGADRFEFGDRVTVLTYLTPYVPEYGQVRGLRRIHELPGSPTVAALVATDADQHVPGPFEMPRSSWPKPTQTPQQRSSSWREKNGVDFPLLGVAPDKMPEDSTIMRFDAVVDRDRHVVYVATQSDPYGCIEEAVVLRELAR